MHRKRPRAARAESNLPAYIRNVGDYYSSIVGDAPMTPPVSTDGSTEEQKQHSALLMEMFKDVLENPEGQEEEEAFVLDLLQSTSERWVRDIIKADERAAAELLRYHCQVFQFGSTHLGVTNEASDLDVVLVTSRIATREQFFATLPGLLEKHDAVGEVTVLSEAFVPIIRCRVNKMNVDIAYARLGKQELSRTVTRDLSSDSIFKDCDRQSVLSLNDRRVSEKIQKLVPDVDKFRKLLRIVKHWAKQRGIYSSSLGFLGGVNWAILAARVCQMYPALSVGCLVKRFFMVWAQWKWPTPVLLCPMRPKHFFKSTASYDIHSMQWSPRMISTKNELFPIITPAFPCMNSARGITSSVALTLKKEFSRAFNLVNGYPFDAKAAWSSLLNDRFHIEDASSRFLCLKISAPDEKTLQRWTMLVLHKVRTLVGRLDKIEFIVPRLLPRVLPSLKSKRLAYVLISIGIDVLKNNHFKWKKHTVTKGMMKTVDLNDTVRGVARLLQAQSIPGCDLAGEVIIVPEEGHDRKQFFADINLDNWSEVFER